MKVLIAASEAVPYAKTGGLADVTGTLLKELRRRKIDASLILPLYGKVREQGRALTDTGTTVTVPVGSRKIGGRIFAAGHSTYFLECPEFFDRPELYGTPEGDYADNAVRFIFFSRGVLEACKALGVSPDVIHCNDWQTALVPLYLKTLYRDNTLFRNTAAVFSIHNLGYQGHFPPAEILQMNLGTGIYTREGIEFYGKVNFLKAGVLTADRIITVSPSYAKEILTPEFGFGLDGVLRKRSRDLRGILNGIDYEEWNPSRDPFLASHYRAADITGKSSCKRALLKSLFPGSKSHRDDRVPLMSLVGRLSDQKGLDIVIKSAEEFLSFGAKLVILGKGEERLQQACKELAGRHRKTVAVTIGFDEQFAHSVYAGSDFFLMPSQYEPCGLGQLIALRYGTVPIARKTGGLSDTIQDHVPFTKKGTGFLFTDYTPSAFLDTVKRAFCIYKDTGTMDAIVRNGMRKDFSWKASAGKYLEVYHDAFRRKSIQDIPSWK
jgi:starch synthase